MPVLRIIILLIQESRLTQLDHSEILTRDIQGILRITQEANLESLDLRVPRSLVNLVNMALKSNLNQGQRLNRMKDQAHDNFNNHQLLMSRCELQTELLRKEHMITLVNLPMSTIVLLFHHPKITLLMTPQS